MNQEELSSVYSELIKTYNTGIIDQNAKMLTAFVKDDRVLLFKGEATRKQYVQLRQYRAECFILFGLFAEGIKECRLALMLAEKKVQEDLYFLWLKLLFTQFMSAEDQKDLVRIAKAAVVVAQKGNDAIVKSKDAEYQRLAFANNEAFFRVYLGERQEVLDLYQRFKFTPIPIATYNDKEALSFLFSNFNKGLAVAIELQDAVLLRHLLQVISIDDQVLYSNKSLFEIFHNTLITTMDTHPQFAAEFDRMFQLQHKVRNEMKELSFFLTSISSNMMEALEMAFKLFK